MPNDPAFSNPDPLFTAREAAAYLRRGVSTTWRDVAAGRLPKPVYLSPRAPRWRKSELDAALAPRAADSK